MVQEYVLAIEIHEIAVRLFIIEAGIGKDGIHHHAIVLIKMADRPYQRVKKVFCILVFTKFYELGTGHITYRYYRPFFYPQSGLYTFEDGICLIIHILIQAGKIILADRSG